MYVKIHKNLDNTGSSYNLVHYLMEKDQSRNYLHNLFFTREQHAIWYLNVSYKIDSNIKGLKSKEAKFYLITLNPSRDELKHIATLSTYGRKVNDIQQLEDSEVSRYHDHLIAYTNAIIDDYAHNFNRNITYNDIFYFGKVSLYRRYSLLNMDVRKGIAKPGEIKPGFHSHCFIIMSRKDKSQTKSLSPLAASRGVSQNHKLNGKSIQVGFNRCQFKQDCEDRFDKMFGYKRSENERFQYMNFMKRE